METELKESAIPGVAAPRYHQPLQVACPLVSGPINSMAFVRQRPDRRPILIATKAMLSMGQDTISGEQSEQSHLRLDDLSRSTCHKKPANDMGMALLPNPRFRTHQSLVDSNEQC